MFRLIKSLKGNNQCETTKLYANGSLTVVYGSAVGCGSSGITSPSATVSPDFIVIDTVSAGEQKKVDAIIVSEDMVFKVEYTGTANPYIGMPVGLASYKGTMDAVSYNSNGKGTIIAIEDDDRRYVHVRFRK